VKYAQSLLLFLASWISGAYFAFAAGPVAVDPRLAKFESERVAAIEKAMPTAVSVFVPGGAGGGSGMLISSDGFALTNFHVSSPAGSFMRCGLSDGNIYDAVIVGIDPVGDLALIQLLGRSDFPAAEMADSRKAKAGDWCMVIGNPFLLATNLQPTVSWGILSGVGRYQYPSGTLLEYADCFQTDASINPGNSGGPLYNAQGQLLGVVGRASFEKRGRVNVGVGYAISINQAKNFLGYLQSGRIVDHATLGATVASDPDGSVRISNILDSSDAYRRGLRYSAEVLSIDGRDVFTANDVQSILATLPNLWRVKLSYRLEGKRYDTLVRLASVHLEDELLEKMSAALPPPPPRQQTPEKPAENPDAPGEDAHGEEGAEADGEDAIPAVVKERFEAKKGYANYFFNRRHQQRLIGAMRAQFPGQDDASLKQWTIEGETNDAIQSRSKSNSKRINRCCRSETKWFRWVLKLNSMMPCVRAQCLDYYPRWMHGDVCCMLDRTSLVRRIT
jgi:serine protease Do